MKEQIVHAAVIGSPVAHSLSPAIHNAVFADTGRHWTYEAVEVRKEVLPVVLDQLAGENFRALSVTMPLKEVIGEYLASMDDVATTLAAVNCLVYRDGGWHGTNTDGGGCIKALESHAHVSCVGSTMLLAGAGGTARAIALAAVRHGMTVRVVNRTPERAAKLVDMVRTNVPDADIVQLAPHERTAFDVLVNATSVGMGSAVDDDDALPVSRDVIGRCGVVLDAVYQPLETQLLRCAAENGAVVVDGLWMLIHQAVLQHHWWFSHETDFRVPDHVVMRSAAERELERRHQ
ncbi:MAG: shikimate dehydrogenase [Actinomycetota bacterium]